MWNQQISGKIILFQKKYNGKKKMIKRERLSGGAESFSNLNKTAFRPREWNARHWVIL